MLRRRRKVRAVAVDPATGAVVSPLPFAAMVVMAASFFLYAAGGMLVPWWAWVGLVLAWLALFPSTLRDWDSAPARPLRIALASVAIWVVVVVGGGLLLGWEPWWGTSDFWS